MCTYLVVVEIAEEKEDTRMFSTTECQDLLCVLREEIMRVGMWFD